MKKPMRVITGTARGRKLTAPRGMDTRPTTAVAKEAMFSAIQFEVEGARVLDLYAGSGQMGIEALSRGAQSCVFVDNAKASQAVIRDNLEHTGLRDRAKLISSDVQTFLRTTRLQFDIAFLDPPYAAGLMKRSLIAVEPLMQEGGVILCEIPAGMDLPEQVGLFTIAKRYRYGKTECALYRRQMEE